MAILKFRIYFEEDDSIYRDVVVRHTQSFLQLHQVILKAYEFDSKHQATFYRSNDNWQRGREITLEKYNKAYRAEPLLMESTTIGSEIRDPNQKFVYVYDFVKNWGFLVELINVSREENGKLDYPAVVKSEGIPPSQYGTKGLVGDKLTEMEEKYDLTKGTGLARGSLYKAFNDKHSLFVAALEHYIAGSLKRLANDLAQPGSAKAALRHTLMGYAERASSQDGQRSCLVTGAAMEMVPEDPAVSAAIARLFRRTQDLFAATVIRGQAMGKSGSTGLAGGDHLHFSMQVGGVEVNPVEWWDAHWIKDHVQDRLKKQ